MDGWTDGQMDATNCIIFVFIFINYFFLPNALSFIPSSELIEMDGWALPNLLSDPCKDDNYDSGLICLL